MPFEVRRSIGSLVEARVAGLANVEEANAYGTAFAPVFTTAGDRPILLADHRPVSIYKPEVTDVLVAMFRALNTRWARAALVVAPTNATLRLQLERIVRDSANSSRRVFVEPAAALEFLSDALSDAEKNRAHAFLGEWPPR